MKLKTKIQEEFYKSMLNNIPEDIVFNYVMNNMYDAVREGVAEQEGDSRLE